jgi:uncharacterized protein (TIGR04255 family)
LQKVDLLHEFLTKYNIKLLNKVWLRYLNIFNEDVLTQVQDIQKYINAYLCHNISFAKDGLDKTFSRAMSELILNEEDNYVKLSYWYFNKDYPNQLVKPEFVLDIDCVSNLPIDIANDTITNLVTNYNTQIENIFEKSITDDLRRFIN